jgi:peptidoglycan/xylan/chitin deacetylase (PgdA/CDA1 family)
MRALKQLFKAVVATPGVVPRLLRKSDAGVIFMLHRFPDPEIGNPSEHDLDAIRGMLGYLRKNRFELISLAGLFERAANGDRLSGAIGFTIDDGYLDHARIGAPLFAEFDCPVTTFLTSGFLDGAVWFWWDKIDYVFRTTQLRTVDVAVSDSPIALEWSTPAERADAQSAFTAACKLVNEEEKNSAIARLAVAADVEIPERAPLAYAPMSWSDARRCEQSGMTFGPHTVSHPILSRTTDSQSRFEIEESWRRVSSELAKPVSVFCYPNGQATDFGERETAALASAGLRGAVVGFPGYATGDDIRHRDNRFRVRRFAMPGNSADLIQYVTGLERVKARIRAVRS